MESSYRILILSGLGEIHLNLFTVHFTTKEIFIQRNQIGCDQRSGWNENTSVTASNPVLSAVSKAASVVDASSLSFWSYRAVFWKNFFVFEKQVNEIEMLRKDFQNWNPEIEAENVSQCLIILSRGQWWWFPLDIDKVYLTAKNHWF